MGYDSRALANDPSLIYSYGSQLHHAKTHLSGLIQQAENGEEVIIARDGKPAVKLVPVQPETPEPDLPRCQGGSRAS